MNYKVCASRVNDESDISKILLEHFQHKLSHIKPNSLVLLKPNMFMTEKWYYTNPSILKELAKLFTGLGAKVVIAERLRVISQILKHVPDIEEICDVMSFDDLPMTTLKIDGATSLRQEIKIPSILIECDFFVGVPQFRTHAGILMSNALKNMVGILPGFTTRIVHNVGLTEAIVDLNRIREQDLVVADLTTTIEGNYPIEGIPMHRNLTVIGDNALAVDLISADLSGFRTDEIEYLGLSGKANLGPTEINQIEVVSNYNELKFQCVKSGLPIQKQNENIAICIKDACPECVRFSNSLNQLLNEKILLRNEILIATGSTLTENNFRLPESSTILIGNCTYRHRDKGIFVEGCPPRAIQAIAVSEWINNSGKIDETYKNQCRWPDIKEET